MFFMAPCDIVLPLAVGHLTTLMTLHKEDFGKLAKEIPPKKKKKILCPVCRSGPFDIFFLGNRKCKASPYHALTHTLTLRGIPPDRAAAQCGWSVGTETPAAVFSGGNRKLLAAFS